MSSGEVEVTLDVEYAQTDAGPLALDLYRPAGVEAAATVLYLHGGGWAVGDRKAYANERLVPVAARGVAVASAAYRFTDVATFPSQLHDVKGAIRWLRAHADDLGLATERIGAWGASAGGYLALMLGLTGGVAEFEGDVGGNSERDSSVQAACAWFAPSDLTTLGERPSGPQYTLPPFAAGPPPDPPYHARLLGLRAIEDDLAAARAASPLSFVERTRPGEVSYLLMHGDRDALVAERQSIVLQDALTARGVDSTLVILGGANHEGEQFDRPRVHAALAGFFLDGL